MRAQRTLRSVNMATPFPAPRVQARRALHTSTYPCPLVSAAFLRRCSSAMCDAWLVTREDYPDQGATTQENPGEPYRQRHGSCESGTPLATTRRLATLLLASVVSIGNVPALAAGVPQKVSPTAKVKF
jgi:hypothetical protein